MPNVNGNVHSVRRDIFNHMILHERVDFSVADEVAYNVVHELVNSFLRNFHAIVFDNLLNLVFQIFPCLLLSFKILKADIYFFNQKVFNFAKLLLLPLAKGRLNHLISYLLCNRISYNRGENIRLFYWIDFSKHGQFSFLYSFRLRFHSFPLIYQAIVTSNQTDMGATPRYIA